MKSCLSIHSLINYLVAVFYQIDCLPVHVYGIWYYHNFRHQLQVLECTPADKGWLLYFIASVSFLKHSVCFMSVGIIFGPSSDLLNHIQGVGSSNLFRKALCCPNTCWIWELFLNVIWLHKHSVWLSFLAI